MANTTQTIPFDFNETYEKAQNLFSKKGYDVSEGSNTSQLSTILSYFVSQLNTNTAININDLILPLGTKRSNVLQSARELGYEPSQKISYVYNITLTVQNDGDIVIPKFTEFTAGDKTYYYTGSEINDYYYAGDKISLEIKEGVLTSYIQDSNLTILIEADENNEPYEYVDIPFTDVEENGIEVFARYTYNNSTRNESWTKSETFSLDSGMDLFSQKTFLRQENIEFNTPRIYFRIGSVGETLPIGTQLNINVLQTSGTEGAIESTTSISTNINNVEIDRESLVIITQGSDVESIESIKSNAPLFHNAANRAVTKSDYISICNRHQAVKNTFTWDGNSNYYKTPGQIWFSFTPNYVNRSFSVNDTNKKWTLDNAFQFENWYLEDNLIQSENTDAPGVFDYLLNYSIPTLKFSHIHPIYFDFDINLKIAKYNLITPVKETNTEIFNIINNYFKDETTGLERFDSEYFESALMKRISQANNIDDISGVTLDTNYSVTITPSHFDYDKYSLFDSKYNVKHCYIPLELPYESIFDSNDNLIIDNLPKIDTINITENATNDSKQFENVDVRVQFTDSTKEDLLSFMILVDGSPVGRYNIVSTKTQQYIYLDLYSIDTTYTSIPKINESGESGFFTIGNNSYIGYYKPSVYAPLINNVNIYKNVYNVEDGNITSSQIEEFEQDETVLLNDADNKFNLSGFVCGDNRYVIGGTYALNMDVFDNITINISYPSDNIKFSRNVIPRLKSVTFK